MARPSRAVRDDQARAFAQGRRRARQGAAAGRRWDVLLVIGLGGAIGSLLRYGVSEVLPHDADGIPWSTLLVNVVGCLAIGAFLVMITETAVSHRLLRPFVAVGVLGGLTTFSTYAVEALQLVRGHEPQLAVLYVLGTVVATLGSVLAGVLGMRLVLRLASRRRGANRRLEGGTG